MERSFLAALPNPRPATDQHVEVRVSKDGFIRFGKSRLLRAARPCGSPAWVPADVVLDPARLRAAPGTRCETADVAIALVNLARYDAAVEVAP